MKKHLLLSIILVVSTLVNAQNTVSATIQEIYKTALVDGESYGWLGHLSNQIGGRLSGSLNAQRAVEWGQEELEASCPLIGFGYSPLWYPKRIRGTFEYANIETSPEVTIMFPYVP